MSNVYKIHPSIGFARVGDSAEYYLAPETAGGLPILAGENAKDFGPGDFRDGAGRLRRQAARFRVFCYASNAADDPGQEVVPGKDGVKAIEWRVHVANKKPIWYAFQTSLGQDGYAPDHPMRNPRVVDPKARTELIIDPGPRTLSGPGETAQFARESDAGGYPMTWPPKGLEPAEINSLGEIHTDRQSRLIFVGGYGHSGSTRPPAITHYANNDDWWDDTSDGPVTATIVMEDGRREEVEFPAWVVVGPPKYAPQIENLVTLYDTMLDAAVRKMGARPAMYRDEMWQRDYRPNFETEIAPIFRRGAGYPWVAPIPPFAHRFDMAKLGDPAPEFNSLRQYMLQILRPPGGPDLLIGPSGGGMDQTNAAPGMTMMPYLAGDNAFFYGAGTSKFLKLTDTQYFLLQQWAAGYFDPNPAPREAAGPALDRATLENCVGGAFSPGIEMTWISRNPAIYQEPLRLKHKKNVKAPLSLGGNLAEGLEPGDGAKYMALPWQADFNECAAQPVELQMGPSADSITTRIVWWWPAQRPIAVWKRDERSPSGKKQVAWAGTLADQNAGDYVMFGDDLDMVEGWKTLGFLYNYGTKEKPEVLLVEPPINAGKSDIGDGKV